MFVYLRPHRRRLAEHRASIPDQTLTTLTPRVYSFTTSGGCLEPNQKLAIMLLTVICTL